MNQLKKKKEFTDLGNSFLNETLYNSDIDDDIRYQIERRFVQSKTNRTYVFPRKSRKLQQKPNKSKPRQRAHAKTLTVPALSPSKSSFTTRTLTSSRLKKSPTAKAIRTPYMHSLSSFPSLSKALLSSSSSKPLLRLKH